MPRLVLQAPQWRVFTSEDVESLAGELLAADSSYDVEVSRYEVKSLDPMFLAVSIWVVQQAGSVAVKDVIGAAVKRVAA